MEDIVIKKDGDYGFDVWQGDKHSEHLGFEEMLGLISALTMPENRPCIQWMRTEEEWRRWRSKVYNATNKNDAEFE